MKAKIAITVSALLLGTITTANADLYIQSPIGLTQAQWNASDAYKNFTCPAGYGRGEGIDMNFTTSRADDFWFVSCSLIDVFVEPETLRPTPIVTPSPTPSSTPSSTETVTATVAPSPTPAPSPTTTTETTTAVTDTTTATSASVTVDSLYAQIMALFTQLLALIAKLQR
jgi:hypothetical protein